MMDKQTKKTKKPKPPPLEPEHLPKYPKLVPKDDITEYTKDGRIILHIT